MRDGNEKPLHHGRDHRKGGEDPIPNIGIDNHFVQASGAFVNIASDGGAPTSPTPIAVGIGIDRQSAGSEELFFISSGGVDYLTIALPGTYTVRAVAAFPEGMTGYINVEGTIGGDAYLYAVLAPKYVPASYSGTGGGVVIWEQTIEVLASAVVGTGTEVGVFPSVWQNSGSNRSGGAFVQVLRHT